MIAVKRVEIRDRATFIPAIALRIVGGASDDPLVWRAGFGKEGAIVLIHLEGQTCRWDPYAWPAPSRTMREAHIWLVGHWDAFQDGDVVDVEYILGETVVPKENEARG